MQFCFTWARQYWQWKPRTKGTLIVIEAGLSTALQHPQILGHASSFSQISWSLSCCPSISFKIDRILIEISTNERPASYFSQPIRSSFAIGRQPFREVKLIIFRPLLTFNILLLAVGNISLRLPHRLSLATSPSWVVPPFQFKQSNQSFTFTFGRDTESAPV